MIVGGGLVIHTIRYSYLSIVTHAYTSVPAHGYALERELAEVRAVVLSATTRSVERREGQSKVHPSPPEPWLNG